MLNSQNNLKFKKRACKNTFSNSNQCLLFSTMALLDNLCLSPVHKLEKCILYLFCFLHFSEGMR